MAARRVLLLAIGLLLLALGLPQAVASAADRTLTLVFSCSGGPFDAASLTVPLSMPDTAGGTFDITWKIPQLTLSEAATTASQIKIVGALVVTGGTHAGLDKTGASVAAGATSVAASSVVSTVTGVSGGEVTVGASIETGSLTLSLASAPDEVTSCTTDSTESVVVSAGQGSDAGNVVDYRCGNQDVKIRVSLTVPADARVNQQFSIGWQGTYVGGSELKATEALDPTIFAYASLTGVGDVHSATGSGPLGTITPGEIVPLPTSTVPMNTTVHQVGTATAKPAKVNFGAKSGTGNRPMVVCSPSGAVKEYTFQVRGAQGAEPTVTPTSTAAATHTSTPTPEIGRSRTPRAGADTGGGGSAGADGRVFLLVGVLLLGGSLAGGLALRARAR